jgi:hypothetical protein
MLVSERHALRQGDRREEGLGRFRPNAFLPAPDAAHERSSPITSFTLDRRSDFIFPPLIFRN